MKSAYIEPVDDDQENKQSSNNQDEENRDISSIEFFNVLENLMKPSLTNIRLLYAAGLLLILTLMIRLFSVDNFGGKPNLLDFGPKVGKNGSIEDTNIAFETLNFSTFGHFIQGCLAAFFSYPSVAGIISRIAAKMKGFVLRSESFRTASDSRYRSLLLVKPCVFTLGLIHFLSACLTGYMFYSMVKRLAYKSSSFAQTSHSNNATEWAVGFILGVSLGRLATVLLQRHLILATETQENRRVFVTEFEVNQEEYGFGKLSEYKAVTRHTIALRIIEILSLSILFVFAVTTFLTGLLFGLSWNYKENDSTVNAGMVTIFVFMNIIVYTAIFFLSL